MKKLSDFTLLQATQMATEHINKARLAKTAGFIKMYEMRMSAFRMINKVRKMKKLTILVSPTQLLAPYFAEYLTKMGHNVKASKDHCSYINTINVDHCTKVRVIFDALWNEYAKH